MTIIIIYIIKKFVNLYILNVRNRIIKIWINDIIKRSYNLVIIDRNIKLYFKLIK